ncbi:MAG TPA: M20/M25/M40 family metallo-hydrolase, partial [Casimicrobiaceae bacterium]|nr:M20/M25/M40 family metallo-hydrolase [Casimicrobiaceae bacterium]
MATPFAQRILARCDALAQHSEQQGALTRMALSPEQREANTLVLGWMREAGMSTRLDAMANCIGRYEGTVADTACLMLGSHLDTVRDAGRYDGMLGVVTAIECVDALNRQGRRLPFAIEVIGFADEEGLRFGATLLGSRAIAGTLEGAVLDKRDRDGTMLRDAMRAFGLDPDALRSAVRHSGEVLAYAELHIEQGPVLEALGLPVGVVTA